VVITSGQFQVQLEKGVPVSFVRGKEVELIWDALTFDKPRKPIELNISCLGKIYESYLSLNFSD
jgi:hypothetical protein